MRIRSTAPAAMSRRSLLTLLGAGASLAALRPAPLRAAPSVATTVKVAEGLYELAVSQASGLVHVAAVGARGANAAKIIGLDPRTLEVRATIELGEDAAFGLASNDRRGLLLATGTRSGAFKIIDVRSGSVRAKLTQGESSHLRQVVVDEARDRAFATSFGARDRPSAIWVVDTAGDRILNVITEGLEGGITGLAFDAANDRLFATALTANEIVEVSLSRNAGIRRFASGGEGSVNTAFDAASGRLFCANQRSGTLTVLNANSGELVKSIETGAGALGVTLSADGALCYVANRGAGTVSLVDTRNLTVVASLATGTHPNTVAIDRRSGLAYASNKARAQPRGPRPAAGEAPAPRPAPVEDPNGDTVSIIRL
ncbi:YncE family protein [Falsiroseomonas tokyonensis]|uniref:YncE family protein n=1 Tax=Falsiroseomonas tokyonensis TaxID=430521 RepID=A0ABV7BZE9_9PROT|nr:YncE family protein [Falsiroseomonas tokyonensis]MBU8540381.1 YncE family protein [Falsiroseomonas tokyonensis]